MTNIIRASVFTPKKQKRISSSKKEQLPSTLVDTTPHDAAQ